MRRVLEYVAYAFIILVFIVRYAGGDEVSPRRPEIRTPASEPPKLLPERAQLPRDNVDRVEVQLDAKATSGVGTAFAVDGAGTYVTARHVVDGCHEVYISKTKGRYTPVSNVIIDQKRDFAIIDAGSFRARPVTLASFAPDRGVDGYMMGYPQGSPADVRATVIGRSEMRSSGRYRAREPVVAWVERERKPLFDGSLGGISGGPVFDGEGIVVGTVVAGSPRRGRVYTTHPRVFMQGDILKRANFRGGTEQNLLNALNRQNYDDAGDELRKTGTIAQVYCRVL
jgi:S1-C subfamily serine protease